MNKKYWFGLGLGMLTGLIAGTVTTSIRLHQLCHPGPSTMVAEQDYQVFGVFDDRVDLKVVNPKINNNDDSYWIPCYEGPCKNLHPGDKVMLAAVYYQDLTVEEGEGTSYGKYE